MSSLSFHLPRDIVSTVAVRYLTVRDVMRWLATCRYYHLLLTDRCSEFWRRVSIIADADSYAQWRRIHLDVFDRGYAPGSEVVRLFGQAAQHVQLAMLRRVKVPLPFFHMEQHLEAPPTIDMSTSSRESTRPEVLERYRSSMRIWAEYPEEEWRRMAQEGIEPWNFVAFVHFNIPCPIHYEKVAAQPPDHYNPLPVLDLFYVLAEDEYSFRRYVTTCPCDQLEDACYKCIDTKYAGGLGGGVLVAGVVKGWKRHLMDL